METGRKFNKWLLGLLALGALGWGWHRLQESHLGAQPQGAPEIAQPSKPAVQTGVSVAAPPTPTRPTHTPESMADAAYRACVLANQVKRQELLLALVDEMSAETTRPFLEELMRGNRTPIKPGQAVWNAFWRKWGAIDGKTCLDELISRGQQNRISSDGMLAMEGWASADPQAAAEWLKVEQPDSALWNSAWATYQIKSRSGELLQDTPQILQAADTPTKLDAACQQLADQAQLQKGAPGLIEWFEAVPNEARSGAVNHFLWRLISSDPQSAVDFMTKNAQAPWRNDLHSGKLINEISKQDPAGTATWAATLYPSPAGTPQEQNPVFQATQRWAERDPAAAKSWLDANAQQPWAATANAAYARGAPEIEADR